MSRGLGWDLPAGVTPGDLCGDDACGCADAVERAEERVIDIAVAAEAAVDRIVEVLPDEVLGFDDVRAVLRDLRRMAQGDGIDRCPECGERQGFGWVICKDCDADRPEQLLLLDGVAA